MRTHCRRGHELTAENVYLRRGGYLECKCCRAARRTGALEELRPLTHCPWGHEFTPENTYSHPSGVSVCRICKRAARQRYKRTKRGQQTENLLKRRSYNARMNARDIDTILLLAQQNPWIHTIPELKELVDGS